MNLGIVIGVSDYPDGVGKLPACATDAAAIAALLGTESKFDSVLVVSENTVSSSVKRQLAEFVAQHKGKGVDEVFFYYTGHGDFADGEFYYLLSDYDPKRRKQTSLENSEVDSLLKALSPTTAVKFIDACHSGVTYIKDSTAFDTYLKGTGQTFQKCYFLFSSQVEQYSYQDSGLSFFTRAVVDSVLTHDDADLRYKDVIDHVSDAFSSDSQQTPFFVVQADFTETFCTVSPTLKAALRKAVDDAGPPTTKPAQPVASLADRVKEDASRYCTENETREALSELQQQLQSVPHPSDLDGLFAISVLQGTEFSDIPNATAIGNWLSQNQHTFFASPYSRPVKVKKRKLKNPLLANLALFDEDAYRIVEEEEMRVCGFRPTIDMPYLFLLLQAEPLFPNITASDCFVVPLVSKTEIRLFYTFCRYRDVGWDKRQRHSEFKWVTQSFPTKDSSSLGTAVSAIAVKLWDFVGEQLHDRFGPPDSTDSDADEPIDADDNGEAEDPTAV
ncbi:MAG: caspase family protein [Planctomycetota bacterium]|jgi:hypothetical protein